MSEAQIRIRRATSADVDEMLKLLRATDLPVDGVAAASGDYLVAATKNGNIVALGGLEPHGPDALLRSLAVAAGHRNQGLGKRVFDRLWQKAEAEGFSEIYLLTTTAADYFERLGFCRVARESAPGAIRLSREFSGICPDSAVLMRRTAGARA